MGVQGTKISQLLLSKLQYSYFLFLCVVKILKKKQPNQPKNPQTNQLTKQKKKTQQTKTTKMHTNLLLGLFYSPQYCVSWQTPVMFCWNNSR